MNIEPVKLPTQRIDPLPVILLVDGDVELLQVISRFLKDFGYAVLEAESAFEAVLVFVEAQGKVEFLLTDLNIGSSQGTDLAVLLTTILPSLKVLIISGQIGLPNTMIVKDRQFPCLAKPFTKKQLQQRIEEILGRPGSTQTSVAGPGGS